VRASVVTHEAPRPSGAYSQGVIAGGFLFTAGMGPHRPDGHAVVGETIEEQTRQTLANLDAVLRAAGMNRDDVVKVTAHLQELDRDFDGYDAVYQEFFRPPFPARITVGSALSGILLEVDFIAVRSADHSE
jgi:2-iminobutanoate/2-iminopropanoate deaminase